MNRLLPASLATQKLTLSIRSVQTRKQLGFLLIRQLLNSLQIRQRLITQRKRPCHRSTQLIQSSATAQAQRAGRSAIKRILNNVIAVLHLNRLHAERNPLLIEAALDSLRLHEQPAKVPASRAKLAEPRRLALEQVILQAVLAANRLEHAQRQAGLDAGVERREVEGFDVHIGPPEAPRLFVMLGRNVVAEADAGVAVEAAVGLLVYPALAVGVWRDQVRGEEVCLDGLGLGGVRARKGSSRQ